MYRGQIKAVQRERLHFTPHPLFHEYICRSTLLTIEDHLAFQRALGTPLFTSASMLHLRAALRTEAQPIRDHGGHLYTQYDVKNLYRIAGLCRAQRVHHLHATLVRSLATQKQHFTEHSEHFSNGLCHARAYTIVRAASLEDSNTAKWATAEIHRESAKLFRDQSRDAARHDLCYTLGLDRTDCMRRGPQGTVTQQFPAVPS